MIPAAVFVVALLVAALAGRLIIRTAAVFVVVVVGLNYVAHVSVWSMLLGWWLG